MSFSSSNKEFSSFQEMCPLFSWTLMIECWLYSVTGILRNQTLHFISLFFSWPLICTWLLEWRVAFSFSSSDQPEKESAIPPPTNTSNGGKGQNVAAPSERVNSAQKGEFCCLLLLAASHPEPQASFCASRVSLPCPHISPWLPNGLCGAGKRGASRTKSQVQWWAALHARGWHVQACIIER